MVIFKGLNKYFSLFPIFCCVLYLCSVVVSVAGCHIVVTGDDAESVCSCTEREGDAFPKAFERELVTPTNLEESGDQRLLEERRKSLLDHHWAIPSRDRQSIDTDEMPVISMSAPDDSTNDNEDDDNDVKESCHDSGIDIRESCVPPPPPIVPIHTKKVITSFTCRFYTIYQFPVFCYL